MSLLVIGLSHHRAPIDVLERAALDETRRARLATLASQSDDVVESVVVSTCNRTEIYAEVGTFHGAVADLTDALVEDKVRELAWTIDEHGRRRLTPGGLYGRRKMTPLVRRSLPEATPGAVDRAMRPLGLSGVRRAKGIRTTIRPRTAAAPATC